MASFHGELRYRGRYKVKVKIENLTKKLKFLGKFIFFTQTLARVQLVH